jgi:predicted metal-dependent hydrolase
LPIAVRVEPGELRVQELGYRWGSCTPSNLNFHCRTMQLPPRIIEYVIAKAARAGSRDA